MSYTKTSYDAVMNLKQRIKRDANSSSNRNEINPILFHNVKSSWLFNEVCKVKTKSKSKFCCGEGFK